MIQPVMSRVTHGHLFCGSGFGAKGMQEAHARVGTLEAEMECVGGIDVDPVACMDFERLTGVPATCMDLFDEAQFRDWHAACKRKSKRCKICFNTGEPPTGWRPATGAEVRAAFSKRPNIFFLSSPCKGLSGLQTPKRSQSNAYQALNRLTVRGVQLMLEAFEDDPPELVVFENVPLIATRGRPLLDEIRDLLFLHGYAVAETFHDCGELGGLAQRRRRFLLVARHRAKVPPFLYEPVKHRLKGVGEVIGGLPLPDAPGSGPMHRCPRLTWETWVRLALIPAGGDWRSLEGMDFTKLGIEPLPARYGHSGALGVSSWSEPSGTVSGRGGPSNGAYSVQDPRIASVHHAAQRHNDVFRVVDWSDPSGTATAGGGSTSGGQAISDPRNGDHGSYQTYRVIRFDEPAPTISAQSAPGGGGYTVADPRWGGGAFGVQPWAEPSGAVTGEGYPSNGRFSVQDPRPATGYHSQQAQKWEVTPFDEPARTVLAANGTGNGASAIADPRLGSYGQHASKLRVEDWEKPSHTVTTSDRVGSGAPSVADPRIPAYHNLCRVESWDEPAHTVTSGIRPAGGALSVADPRVDAKARREDFRSSGHYGVVEWTEPSNAVTAHGQHDNSASSVADPRPIPAPLDRPDPVPVIFALDGTWHRPFTTLDLAALQFGEDFARELMDKPLSGTSHTVWREHIGNAVPRASARAIGSVMAHTLLMARSGQTFRLSTTPVWVQPLAIAVSLDARDVREITG